MKTRTIVIVGVMLALGMLINGASRHSIAVQSPESNSAIDNSQGRRAPDFELKTLAGRSVKLSAFHNQPIVLNFWATYCGPCRVEMPWLIDLYKKYHPRGLEVVGISMDDDGEQHQITDFVREFRVNYTILLGNNIVRDAFGGVRFLPQTLFIDRNGHIKTSVTGMKSKTEFERLIKQIL